MKYANEIIQSEANKEQRSWNLVTMSLAEACVKILLKRILNSSLTKFY